MRMYSKSEVELLVRYATMNLNGLVMEVFAVGGLGILAGQDPRDFIREVGRKFCDNVEQLQKELEPRTAELEALVKEFADEAQEIQN